jgi:DNA-binding IscR family transcriptional regulator
MVISVSGIRGGWTLGEDPSAIHLSDVYKAVEPGRILPIHSDTNPACLVGRNIENALGSIYANLQNIFESSLEKWCILDILEKVKENDQMR